MRVVAYDPVLGDRQPPDGIEVAVWPERVEEADFIVLTCALTAANRHMLNESTSWRARDAASESSTSHEARLSTKLRLSRRFEAARCQQRRSMCSRRSRWPPARRCGEFDQCILGSHNGSNTVDAVRRASNRAIDLLFGFLGVS